MPLRDLILQAVEVLRDTELRFILVGGAATLWLGSERSTTDVDILIDSGISLIPTVSKTDKLVIEGSEMWYKPGGIFNVKIDVQRNIVEENYQTLDPNTVEVNGVKVLTPEYALALRVFCFHRRGEGYHYDLKRYSDIIERIFSFTATE